MAKKIIKPYWENEENWECYKNGMYDSRLNELYVEKSYKILVDEESLYNKMFQVTKDYPISTKVNFTNKMFNPISWLGQACCNLFENSTSRETINAWISLTEQQQNKANETAKKVIEGWLSEYENL